MFLREVTHRFSLPPGKYVVVPSTFNPKEQGDFIVRVFSEKEQSAQNLDEQTEVDESQVITRAVWNFMIHECETNYG